MKTLLVFLVDTFIRFLVICPWAAKIFYVVQYIVPMRAYHRERLKILLSRISRKDKIYEMLKKLASFQKKSRYAVERGLLLNTIFLKPVSCGMQKNLPPRVVNIFITSRCNCNCQYCFVKGTHQDEMSDELLMKALDEINDFSPSFVCLSGGEPLMRENVFEIIKKYPDILFLIFTNGLCLTPEMCAKISSLGNIMLMFSIDGFEATTSKKRNPQVWPQFLKASELLNASHTPFGFSCHTEQDNFDECVSEAFIDEMVKIGCCIGWYSIHLPMCRHDVSTKVLTSEQRLSLLEVIESQRQKTIILIDSSSDSRFLGRCSAGGSMICHIESNGDICPCQFLPFSVGNIAKMSIKDAIGSAFFTDVRELGTVKCAKDHLAGCSALDKRRGILDLVARHSDTLTKHSLEIAKNWEEYQPVMDEYEKKFAEVIEQKVTFRNKK